MHFIVTSRPPASTSCDAGVAGIGPTNQYKMTLAQFQQNCAGDVAPGWMK